MELRTNSKIASQRGRKKSGRFGAIIICAIFGFSFTGLGGMGLYFIFLRPAYNAFLAQSWVPLTCHIDESHLLNQRSKKSTTYRPEVKYHYEYNGTTFQGDRFDFSRIASSDQSSELARLNKVRVGTEVACFVDPNSPSESVIDRNLGWTPILFGLFISLFPAIGLCFLYGMYRCVVASPEKEGKSIAIAKSSSQLRPSVTKVPSTKVHRSNPWGRLAVIFFIAAFWNGIVSIFLFQAYKGWAAGSPSYFLIVFLVPFVLIGLLLVFFVGGSILNLFNPRLTINLSPEPQALGEKISVSWQISGQRISALKQLSFSLKGKEVVRYRRGTSTSTAQEVFLDRQVRIVQSHELSLHRGAFDLTLPADLVPSMDVPNNQIVWSLTCSGEIPRWPDLTEEVQITVLPLRSNRYA